MKLLRRIGATVLIVFFLTTGLCYGQSPAKQSSIKGLEYAVEGKLEKAKKKFEEALKIDPSLESAKDGLKVIDDVNDKKMEKKAANHFFKGVAYYLKGQWAKAIIEYNKAIEVNPRFALVYHDRGIIYRHKGLYDQAISNCTKAIELNPRYAEAYYNRGVAYLHKDFYDQAISDCNKAIEINSEYAEAYYNRGNTYFDKGQYDKAISDYTKAIEINPRNAEAYNNRGVACYYKGEYNKAWEDVYTAQSLGCQVLPEFFQALREASGRQE